MPHKHTRKGEDNKDNLDLPPSVSAKPLPVSKGARENGIFTADTAARKSNKRKRAADKNDDTPRAFARLMMFQQGKKLPKGLDDGVQHTKKQKKAATKSQSEDTAAAPAAPKPNILTIQPGERMSEFAARVDAALPIAGLVNKSAKGGKDPLGLKIGRTKTEKRMHRMYDEWREQDKKIKEKRQEALELAEADEMEEDESGNVTWKAGAEDAAAAGSGGAGGKKTKKIKGKGKRKKVLGEVDDGEADPWAAVKRARNEARIGLNDVAQAPPTFTKPPREKFRVRGAGVDVGDVPKASGSLRRREELGEERRSVVERYRQMMKDNKATSKQD